MPYFIITYDIGEERVNLVRKTLKKYFTWVQNSVFEGEVSKAQIEQIKVGLNEIIKKSSPFIFNILSKKAKKLYFPQEVFLFYLLLVSTQT